MKKDILFIDIDDTLVRKRTDAPSESRLFLEQSLLYLMREFACQQQGMDRRKAEEIITQICKNIEWWHWTDFIRALDLDHHAFWEYAYREESKLLAPVSEELPQIFENLLAAGYKMFITSHNPCSGILLKLRIARLANGFGSKFFLRYFSPCDLHYMKWDEEFWHRTLAHTGLHPDRIITIGDLWRDDIQCPTAAGIRTRIYLDVKRTVPPEYEDGVWKVANWKQIEHILIENARLDNFVPPARNKPKPRLATAEST
jgi:FMN phosphatase YigB (HAD superfamily)